MPDLGRLYLGIAQFVTTLVLRLYGAAFAVFGALFVYWGGRGLTAYTKGIRAAWTEPGVCLLGVVGGPLIAWFGWRMTRDSATRTTPGFSQAQLLPLSVMALGAAVIAVTMMGNDGVPYSTLAVIAGGAGLVRWWSRRRGHGERQDAENAFFDRIAALERKDPAEAQRQTDPTDAIAAEELRNLLQQDLDVTRHALQDWENAGDLNHHAKAHLIGQLGQTEAELVRVHGFLHALKR